MQQVKNLISTLLLFFLGICWGDLWITEFLLCPEWWFIAINAMLLGVGIFASKFLPEEWKHCIPGTLAVLILLLDISDLRSFLLPLAFGLWYAKDPEFFQQWRKSRTFCGGMVIGGIISAFFGIPPLIIPLTAVLIFIFDGLKKSVPALTEMLVLSIFFLVFYPAQHSDVAPQRIDTGTVMTAFALAETDPASKVIPKIAFLGGDEKDHLRCAAELQPVSNMLFLPDLPGSVPPQSTLIIVSGLPENGTKGIPALKRALSKGGVLVMPVEYCKLLPLETWYILPGSNGRFAAMSPGRELEMDPEKIDDNLIRNFSRFKDASPLAGALSGMLLEFREQKLTFESPVPGNAKYYRIAGTGLLVLLLGIWILHIRRNQADKFRIIINCAGYSLTASLLLPEVLSSLPAEIFVSSISVLSIKALLTSVILMWIFRRPVPKDNGTKLLGFISLLTLCLSWDGNWIPALIALLTSGYAFASLDGELCGERNNEVESLRFFGLAAGAFAAFYLQEYTGTTVLFFTVVIMRFWSWFRS